MGESVFQDLALPSETSTSERMASALSALGESVSFGRFLSESLDWGRFSSFNQKKYLEEAKQYSRPGSVAQKKAFFEARYKKSALLRRSISVMERSSSVAMETLDSVMESSSSVMETFNSVMENSNSVMETFNSVMESSSSVMESSNSVMGSSNSVIESSSLILDGEIGDLGGNGKGDLGLRVSESEIDESYYTAEGKLESFDLGEEMSEIERGKGEGINQDNLIDDSSSRVENCVNCETQNEMNDSAEKEPLQESWVTNQSSKEAKTEKISKIPNSKYGKIPKPFKSSPNSISNNLSSKENISNSNSNSNSSRISSNQGNNSAERIRPASRSALHMSINHPIRADVTPSKADIRTKIARFEAVSKSLKATQSQNVCPKSSKWVPRIAPQTPQSERKSAFGSNYSGRKMVGTESSHISTGNSKFASSKFEKPSFSLYRKSDKREEKEEKAEIELKEFRQSLCFKAKPLPDFYRKMEQTKESNNKVASPMRTITRSISSREKSNYQNAPAVPPPKPVLRSISSSKTGIIEPKLISKSVASFSKDQNRWTITLARR